MSSVSGHTAHSERPERSRNAKAQARHRAKRKAYIEQLEQTVTKLQSALGVTPEQVAALPPPAVKIRELEQENARLLRENDELHRMLEAGGRSLPLEASRRNSLTSFSDSRACDRDYKRRKMDNGLDDLYNPSPPGSSHNDALQRPPPLTIPQSSLPHHYSVSGTHTNSSHSSGPSMFSLNGPPFQIPNTPSGSSSTSSPPFSPAQMHASQQSPAGHRPPLAPPHGLGSYSAGGSQYSVPVKAEDENYSSSSHPPGHHAPPHSGHHYTLPPFSQTVPDHGLDNWHTHGYSSERAPLHR
ncbi:hypothetical protein B0H15DRAFT_866868 [Mycena belliarum]|uniref:BZIP domain-containing protein n=1 Tax=Mycena belliarum TaxID=1033014 RepID=A0AAD6TPB1_9AGAR|nr:hypothetical protein B0H15DRAFT_866868 [Mycena belliae]